MIRERLLVFLINIFCPPLAVMLIAGPGMDCLINTLFFIAGVLPGHIHGFYVTCTYFHRKGKVRKGKYPGGRKRGIYSERVWWGGASWARVQELRWDEEEREMVKRGGIVKTRSGGSATRRDLGTQRGKRHSQRISGIERTRSNTAGRNLESQRLSGLSGQSRIISGTGNQRDVVEVQGWRL